MNRVTGIATTAILLGIVGLAVLGFLSWFFYCPCDRTAGGYLLGSEVTEPVSDWSFVNSMEAVPLCQIQVDAGLLPHSINLNCMADNGELYLSCASCARLRAAGSVYPVTATRVEDPETLDRAWVARARKLGRPTDTPRQEGWWSFRVVSR
jgi:hypothetical protein